MAATSIRSLHFCPVFERNKIFAFDLIFFLAQECGTNWSPYGRPNYFIDPLSPMTSDIGDGVRALLRNSERLYMAKYEELVPAGTVGHAGIFYEHAKFTFYLFFTRSGNVQDFFYSMVYVGRLGIYFYQRGVYDAPNHAVVVIGESLLHYMLQFGPGIFPMFRTIGQNLAAQPESAYI